MIITIPANQNHIACIVFPMNIKYLLRFPQEENISICAWISEIMQNTLK